jgi:hypothetical protein
MFQDPFGEDSRVITSQNESQTLSGKAIELFWRNNYRLGNLEWLKRKVCPCL